MTLTVATRQVLDPAGTLGTYPTTVALAVIAFVSGAAASIGSLLGGTPAALIASALALFAAACVVVIVSGRPSRAPFTARSHFFVHLFALSAVGLSTAATWGSSGSFVEQNWVAIGLGILTIAVAPFRPVRELIAGGTISAILVAAVTLVEAEATITGIPPLSLAAGSAVAILALCYGDATYTASTIRSLERSRRRADVASDALESELRVGLARSVQDDRATILARDVIPFFTDLLGRAELTESDRQRAQRIAESIRKVMVDEADRSWLDAFLAPTAYSMHLTVRVIDRGHLAPKMDTGQRTALRALLVAIGEDRRAGALTISLAPSGAAGTGSIRLAVESPEAARSRYAPFLAVMRLAFTSSSVDLDHTDLIVRFTF